MATISGISAIFQLSVPPIFPVVQIQGFATDDAFEVDDIEPNEVLEGVDGILSGGRVYKAIPFSISLQADSTSNLVFDQWNAAEQAIQDSYVANAVITIPAIGQKWTCTRGFLTRFKAFPDVKRVLHPRKQRITWGYISPAPI